MRKFAYAAVLGCCLFSASAAPAQFYDGPIYGGPAVIPVAPYPSYIPPPPPVVIRDEVPVPVAPEEPAETRQEILDEELPQAAMSGESAMPGGSVMQRSMAVSIPPASAARQPAQSTASASGTVQQMQSELRILREELRLLNELVDQIQTAAGEAEAAPAR